MDLGREGGGTDTTFAVSSASLVQNSKLKRGNRVSLPFSVRFHKADVCLKDCRMDHFNRNPTKSLTDVLRHKNAPPRCNRLR